MKVLKNKIRLEEGSNEKRLLSLLMSRVRHEPLWNEVRHYLQTAAVSYTVGKRKEMGGTSKYAMCRDAQQNLRYAWQSTLNY